jgi:CDP-diacylglycerol--glycerol-3-phosphate 3-phosphatidyltransferase
MATRAVPAPLAQLPNALTVARLAIIPIFVALVIQAGGEASWPAGILFGVAGITDQVDGSGGSSTPWPTGSSLTPL